MTDYLSNLHNLDQIPGADHFYRRNGSWGTIFPLKISVRGNKIFRTKIPVTGSMCCIAQKKSHSHYTLLGLLAVQQCSHTVTGSFFGHLQTMTYIA